jgi:hypothetical protein
VSLVMRRIFLISPANANGKRARMLLNPGAAFALAQRLQTTGAPIGEVFAFISGLYFRGKLAYAEAFAPDSSYVIASGRGLLPPSTIVTVRDLLEIAAVPIDPTDFRYRDPLVQDARKLDAGELVLLGSIATAKYIEPLSSIFGERLLFPREFAGRGDMSRGGLMLRCVRESRELDYVSVATAVRHGPRPPKLVRLQRATSQCPT